MPSHRILDKASEAEKGKEKIGSTLKGIGPTYMDKTGRNGIRVGDILEPDFKEKCSKLLKKHEQLLKLYDFTYDYKAFEEGWWEGIACIRRFKLIDSEYYINQALAESKSVLAEGAQGTLLDIDFGSYPFVTSSNTICAGACTGLGVAPNKISGVIGIFKAYCTRVGSGPFPTELENNVGQHLRDKGSEYGATTGRPRRCGWLDLVALNYSIMINGVTELIMTKVDVLSEMDTIKVCTQYKTKKGTTKQFPYSIENDIEPVYEEFKGWKTDISGIRNYKDLPEETKVYIHFIEKETGVPVKHISVGPGREDIISR
jgi:adenylosuccinate synthase